MSESSHPHCNNESSLGFRFRDILESAPIGVFTSTIEGRLLAVNPAFSRLFGYATPQECMESLSDVVAQLYYDPMDGDDFIRQLEDAGEVVNHECRMLRRDGTVIWVSRNVRCLRDESGKPQGMQGFVTDITERKLHEHERLEEEERFRLLFVNAPVPYQSLDEEGNFLDVNQAFLDVLGYSREDLIGKNFSTILHPDWVSHFQENFPRFKAVGEILGVEFEMVKQDGTIILVSFNGRISRDTQGAFQRTHCIFQDITERSRIARELRKTLEHLREAERISGLGHWTFNLATGEMHASEQACRLFGIAPETSAKCTSTTLLQSIHPDDQEPVRRAWEMAIANRGVFTIEHRIALAGGIRWIREYADLARTTDDNVLGTALDITDRKHAEKELLKFKAISDQAVHGIAITDLQGILLYINAYYARIHGYTPEEVLGRHFSIFHTARQMKDVGRVMHSLLRNGQFNQQEIWHTRNDTSEFPMIMSGVVVKDEHDIPQFLAVTGIDITRRKQAETALLESEERFRLSMEATTDGVWDWNLHTDAVYFSPNYVRMLGYETTEVPAHVTSWIDLIHPEDKAKAFEANMDCIENRVESFAVEFRMQARNGDWKWILGRGRAVSRDASGRAIRLIGTHQDITERKMAEEHIRLMATTDELTGLWNRRYFLQALEQELERAARYGKAFSILLIDIDHFKRINDHYGHDGGDKALRHFAMTLQKELRQVDVMGRLGGEEFGILLPQTSSDGAFHFAERLRECIASSQIPVGDASISITISIGSTTFQVGQTMDEILKSTDDALYRAKNYGRNRTVSHHDAEQP